MLFYNAFIHQEGRQNKKKEKMMRTTDDLKMHVPDYEDRLSFGQVTAS